MKLFPRTFLCLATVTGLTGCAWLKPPDTHSTLAIYEEVAPNLPASRVRTVEVPSVGLTLTISPFPTITDRDVDNAVVQPSDGSVAILLHFDDNGIFILDQVTTADRDQRLVIFLNNRPVGVWLVNRRITDGYFLVEGDFSP